MSARWTLIVLLLAPAVVVPLLVPLYDRIDPELFGFPFFFWFQLALIPVRRRAHRGGLPAVHDRGPPGSRRRRESQP